MKNIILLLACFFSFNCLWARDGIVLKSGNDSILRCPVTAFVVFDYSKTEIEGKDISLEDYIDQKGYKFELKWENAQEISHKDFIKQFNKKTAGIKLKADSTGQEAYKFIIQVRKIDLGNTAKSLIPVGLKTDGGTTLSGRIIIKDSNDNSICNLRFSAIQGLGSVSIESRLLFAYQELRSTIIRYMKKELDDNDELVDEDE